MQYIQGTTTALALAAPIAQQNELNRLQRENARLNREIDGIRAMMYAVQADGKENSDLWFDQYARVCYQMADVMDENEQLRAAIAELDNENCQLKIQLLTALMRR